MAAMRRYLLLLIPALAAADGTFPLRLQDFEEARRFTLEPGGQARVFPAVEALTATGDIRAVEPLAVYLLETITSERKIFEDIQKRQKEGAAAHDRAEVLSDELKQLALKEKAGDRTLGPEIERRTAEKVAAEGRFDQIKKGIEQSCRTIDFIRKLRENLADDCTTLLKGRSGEEAAAGIAAVRRALDVADREQAIYLVRILAGSELPEAEEQLLEILSAPKADDAVRLRAETALAKCLTRRGAETLLGLWEREPEVQGPRVQYVLSLVAKKRLDTIEDARAWVASLP